MGQDATVWIQPLNDTWQALGTGYRRGVWAENLSYVHDDYGPLSCSFDLRRDPSQGTPDLTAWTPCEIEMNAVTVWSGRVKGTPSRDGSDRAVNVQGEGWQAHLDDDEYVPNYIHTKLSDWKDIRSVITELAIGRVGTAAGLVTVGQGAMVLGWPKGSQMNAGVQAFAGAYLDLGPAGVAKRVTITYKKITGAAGTGNFGFLLRGADVPSIITNGAEDIVTDDLGTMSTTGTTTSATFTTSRRYVAVILYWANAAGVTLGEDNTMQISAFTTYADTAYESANASVMKGSAPFRDALARGTFLLSSDWSRIDPAATQIFAIPDFWTDDPQTPREVIDAQNAYYNYVTKIDELRRPILLPQPTRAALEVGAWTPMELQNTSQNSGDDIVNKVYVKAQTPAGDPILVVRTAAQQPGVIPQAITSPAFNNPTFAANTTDWTMFNGTIARTTTAGEFDSAPAGAKITANGVGRGELTAAITGTFKKGITYVVSWRARIGTSSIKSVYVSFSAFDATSVLFTPSSVFQTFMVAWTPTTDHVNSPLYLNYLDGAGTSGAVLFIDSFAIAQATPTLADKRGFNRTKTINIPAALPGDGIAAAQIGDTYLAAHKTTPFKGDIAITGPVRDILTGASIPPERLGMRTRELLRLSNLIDPDTGAAGRDGRMVQVTYTLATDQAVASLDATDANFAAFQARLATLSGVGT